MSHIFIYIFFYFYYRHWKSHSCLEGEKSKNCFSSSLNSTIGFWSIGEKKMSTIVLPKNVQLIMKTFIAFRILMTVHVKTNSRHLLFVIAETLMNHDYRYQHYPSFRMMFPRNIIMFRDLNQNNKTFVNIPTVGFILLLR
jgi:hypothetical protein